MVGCTCELAQMAQRTIDTIVGYQFDESAGCYLQVGQACGKQEFAPLEGAGCIVQPPSAEWCMSTEALWREVKYVSAVNCGDVPKGDLALLQAR